MLIFTLFAFILSVYIGDMLLFVNFIETLQRVRFFLNFNVEYTCQLIAFLKIFKYFDLSFIEDIQADNMGSTLKGF
jgi:hypothetical protein